MKDLIERINRVIYDSRLTPNYFANQAGISPSNLRKMLLGEQTITDRTLNLISSCYNVNYDWLKDGDGEPYLDGSGNIVDTKGKNKENGIPFYEVENFECGTPAGFGGALESTNPDGYFNFPWVKPDGNTFCIKAHGNSMLNIKDPNHSINHGSYVALKHNKVNTIQWGEVYALATANGYIIKKLMPSEREGYVKCVSFNSEEFPPYDLDVNEIYDYAIVVGVATINLW